MSATLWVFGLYAPGRIRIMRGDSWLDSGNTKQVLKHTEDQLDVTTIEKLKMWNKLMSANFQDLHWDENYNK